MSICLGKVVVNSLRTCKVHTVQVQKLVHEAVSKGLLNRAAPVRNITVQERTQNRPGPTSDGGGWKRSRDAGFLRRGSTLVSSVKPEDGSTKMTDLGPTLMGVRLLGTKGSLSMDFDGMDFSVTNIDCLKGGLKEQVTMNSPNSICLNHIPENVYINELQNLMRRFGYTGQFSRYNNGNGKATFVKPKAKDSRVTSWECAASYFKSGKPNRV